MPEIISRPRRLLIISPHFPPVNAPDMQRVRMSLPYFVSAGWEVTVLAADDRDSMAPIEPELLDTVPPAVRVVRVRCLSRRWTSRLGVNNLGWRMLPFLNRAGGRIIQEWRPNVIYFSTTQFITLPLGRLWRRRFGVPFVVDLQDPWVSDYYRQPGAPRPPGGWKYGFASACAGLLEGWTLRRSAHVLSVSRSYLDDLARRHKWWTEVRGSVLTFGTPDADFANVRRRQPASQALLPIGSALRIAYAGRLGPDMLPALEVLFAAVATWKDAPRPVELYFFGTSYAAADQARPTTMECARRHGISHLVHEQPARIGYLDSLRLLLETDLALLLGSEDKAYSPSKVYPTLLAARPTLAVAPAGSVLEHKILELSGAALVTFRLQPGGDAEAAAVLARLIGSQLETPAAPWPEPNYAILNHYSARRVAERQMEIFDTVAAPA